MVDPSRQRKFIVLALLLDYPPFDYDYDDDEDDEDFLSPSPRCQIQAGDKCPCMSDSTAHRERGGLRKSSVGPPWVADDITQQRTQARAQSWKRLVGYQGQLDL